MSAVRNLSLSQIRIDGGTVPREAIDPTTVDEYADAMRRLVSFPPVVVFHDGVATWLADGFHRYYAALKVEAQTIDVDWRIGTVETAKLFAAGANATHGPRRTPGDKRRAIEMVLSTAEGSQWTLAQIAKHCHVAPSWVSVIRAKRNPRKARRRVPHLTRTEQKRARIAAAVAADPAASNRAIGRRLGVDRETVAAVRAKAAVASRGRKHVEGTAPSASLPGTWGYSCAEAEQTAHAAMEALCATRAALTDNDWKRLVGEIGAIP